MFYNLRLTPAIDVSEASAVSTAVPHSLALTVAVGFVVNRAPDAASLVHISTNFDDRYDAHQGDDQEQQHHTFARHLYAKFSTICFHKFEKYFESSSKLNEEQESQSRLYTSSWEENNFLFDNQCLLKIIQRSHRIMICKSQWQQWRKKQRINCRPSVRSHASRV